MTGEDSIDITKDQSRVVRIYDGMMNETPTMLVRNMKKVGASSLTKNTINAKF